MVRAGELIGVAAAGAGVSDTTAERWFGEAGGVMPPAAPVACPGCGPGALSFAEREEIAALRAANGGVREIARALGRSPSTISRELDRGTVQRRSAYRASVAQAGADRRARRPKASKLAANDRLREHVQDRLEHTRVRPLLTAATLPSSPLAMPADGR